MPRAHPASIIAILATALLALPPLLPSSGPAAQPLSPLPPVTREVLPNGLTVLLDPAPEREVVAVQVWYRAGYADDSAPGDAHLLEHLMLDGRTGADFSAAMREMGARTRSATGPETTRFETEVPRAGLDSVLALEADRMRGLQIDRAAVTRAEAEIATEETAQAGRPPQSLADFAERVRPLVFGDHPFGRPFGPVSGPVTPERCRAFYERFYAPDRALLVLAGGFEPERARQAIRTHFGSLPRSGAPASPRPPRPILDGRAQTLTTAGAPHVVVAYLMPEPGSPHSAILPLVPAFLNVEGAPLIEQICSQAGAPARFLGATLDETTGLLCAVARPQGEPAPVADALTAALPLLLESLDAQTFATVRDRWRLAAAKGATNLAARAHARAAAELLGNAAAKPARPIADWTERDLAALAPELRRERSLTVTLGRDSTPPGAPESHPSAGPPAEDP